VLAVSPPKYLEPMTSAPATENRKIIIKLEKKRVERDGLQGSDYERFKQLMQEIVCKQVTCKNKGNQC